MATVDLKQGGSTAGLQMCPTAQPGVVSIRVRGADAAAAKGSALAAADIIEVMDIPAGVVVSNATINVRTADTGTTLTFDLGDTATADEWVDGADGTTAGYKAQGTNGVFSQSILYTSASVLELAIITATAANDDWEVEVLAELTDYTGNPRAQAAKDNP